MVIEVIQTKPRLVFFQAKYDDNLPEFLLEHTRQHVRCLSQFFNLVVINFACDYQRVCSEYRPDLALFEGGINIPSCKRPEIRNTQACPKIAKLGFINADAWCETGPGMLSEMTRCGIESFFSISTTAAEHAPGIADRLFVWPNFVDADVFKDYGMTKLIPALLTGAITSQYPWRNRVYKLIAKQYPTLACPHHGYLSRAKASQVIFGERYARMINASWFAPVCGTTAKDLVRKHLEIPSCRACMITEKSQALEEAGFVDMKNCVFADDHNVLDKLAYLFEHPVELQEITDRGYHLVHSQHTMEKRDQILQWFMLSKALTAHQKIVQTSPFAPLTAVEISSRVQDTPIVVNGLHLKLLYEGDNKLLAGAYDEAELLYRECLSYMRRFPEGKMRLVLCSLYKGNAKLARRRTFELLQYTLAEYKSVEPDPVEWAYYVISLVCIGKLKQAITRANQFRWLSHTELDRTRWMIEMLQHKGHRVPITPACERNCRGGSTYNLPKLGTEKWCEQICIMLRACHQAHFAAILEQALSLRPKGRDQLRKEGRGIICDGHLGLPETVSESGIAVQELLVPRKRGDVLGSFRSQLIYYKVQRRLKTIFGKMLTYTEGARSSFCWPFRD